MPRKAKEVITKKPIEDFKPKEKKIFAFLHLGGIQRIVGTTPVEQIKYKTDFDLFEYDKFENEPQAYELVYKMFKDKFNNAHSNPNIWITDFKCGNVKSIPIRWSLEDVNAGYKMIDDVRYDFVNCLQQKSMIKLDVLALINGILNEFSEVYFISFGKNKNYFSELSTTKQLKKMIYDDVLEYKEKGKYYKSLKRLFAYLRFNESKNKGRIKKLLDFFNSPVGLLATLKGDLEELELLINQTFRPVSDEIVKNQIKHIQDNVPEQYKQLLGHLLNIKSHQELTNEINNVMNEMNSTVQEETKKFIEKNKTLYRL
jgi:hypothetical protein